MKKQNNIVKKRLNTEFPYLCYEERFALCGQPQLRDLKEFQQEGWTHLINLRSQPELESLDFDLPVSCQNLGLKYYHIPVFANGDIDKAALKRNHELLSNSEGRNKYVLHCASGTRSALVLMSHLVFSKSWTISDLPHLAKTLDFHQDKLLGRLAQIMS